MNTTLGRHHRPHTNPIRPPATTSPDAWWLVAYASLGAALIAGEIAVNLVVSGAASDSQITTLRWSGFGAALLALVAAGSFGAARRPVGDRRNESASRRVPAARGVVGLAVAFEAGRAFRFAARLVHEIRLQRDEPLTALELGLNLVIALIVTAALVTTWWLVPSARSAPTGAAAHRELR